MSSESTESTPGVGATTATPGDQKAGSKQPAKDSATKKTSGKQTRHSLWLRKPRPATGKGTQSGIKPRGAKRSDKALEATAQKVERLRKLKLLREAPKTKAEESAADQAKKKKTPDSDAIPKKPPVPETLLRKRKYLEKIRKQVITNLKKKEKRKKNKERHHLQARKTIFRGVPEKR